MRKRDKNLYSIFIGIWPLVFYIIMGFFREGIQINNAGFLNKTVYYLIVYVFMGAILAIVASIKRELFKYKSILYAHVIACVTMICVFIWYMLFFLKIINMSALQVAFLIQPTPASIMLGFVLYTTIRAFFLYKNQNTKH